MWTKLHCVQIKTIICNRPKNKPQRLYTTYIIRLYILEILKLANSPFYQKLDLFLSLLNILKNLKERLFLSY